MRFGSDNQAGVLPQVMAALAKAAEAAKGVAMPAYGADAITARVAARISEIFEREVSVFLVSTGTAANALGLSAYGRPGGIVYCHRHAHILNDEAGAPEFLGSARLMGLPGQHGKIEPGALEAALAGLEPAKVREGHAGHEHHGQPMAVSISQLSELGTAYTLAEIAALAAIAREHAIPLHMDGARFANALVALGCTPAEMSWKAGVDVLSLGGTKNGCLAAEAVVFFDRKAGEEFPFLRKRAGHLVSKGWVVAAQMEAYLADGGWLESARHANRMASILSQGIVRSGKARLAAPTDGNEVFAVMARHRVADLRQAGAIFYEWPEASTGDEVAIRLVASFATTEDEVRHFVSLLA